MSIGYILHGEPVKVAYLYLFYFIGNLYKQYDTNKQKNVMMDQIIGSFSEKFLNSWFENLLLNMAADVTINLF